MRSIDDWRHNHDFHPNSRRGERRTLYVVLLTAGMMTIEIASGYFFGSMALLADGWHMGTHVAALGISLFAYAYARRQAHNPSYSFGTGKVGSLGGFASAVALAMVALFMGVESGRRLISPQHIGFDEAILVALAGLVVNLLSAWLLQDSHGHAHNPAHEGASHHHDHNLRAAYLHVLADAFTSLLAIIALICGKALGWIWMDALMGIVGAVVITRWGLGLIRETGGVLLDGTPDGELTKRLRQLIEADADNRVTDLHLWRLAPGRFATIISLVTRQPRDPTHYKALLEEVDGLAHITIEVQHGAGEMGIDQRQDE